MLKKNIDVDNSINSGQVFLWRKINNYWYGINGEDILKVNQKGHIISYQNKETDFFRENDDIKKILKSISKDVIVKNAIKKFVGLRIVRQDPFQCLISFIISSNSNIPKIKLNLENLCKKFGERIEFDKQEFFLFPKPKRIANASINEITACGLGYRSNFVKEAARIIFQKEIVLDELLNNNYDDVKNLISTIPGVGQKVADCTMLFSLNKLDAFPIDRWMIRILKEYYGDKFQLESKTITEKQYSNFHKKIINQFGPFAGYAQQFLFKMERERYKKKWL